MKSFNLNEINWEKAQGLIPAIIQDTKTRAVLMLGYMNKEALELTLETKKVTFFSRTKNRLWQKGESSRHYLNVKQLYLDCDQDTLLILAEPEGDVCHLGNFNCFNTSPSSPNFLYELETFLEERQSNPQPNSYTSEIFARGTQRLAQKVGEEGVEVALAAVCDQKSELKDESADLLFHLLLLLVDQNIKFEEIIAVLQKRHASHE